MTRTIVFLTIAVCSQFAVAEESNSLLQSSADNGEDTVQDKVLDPVMVTGSRIARDGMEMPYPVDVISVRHSNAAQPMVNLSEVLGTATGITVQNRYNYAQDLQLSSRGFGARSAFGIRGVRIYMDGIPATMPDGQGQAATLNLDVADRIEILRGPFSALYGNHSGGVIQMFTREPDAHPRVRYGFSSGSYGTQKHDIQATGRVGDVGYVLDTSDFETKGYRSHSAASREQSFAKLGFRPVQDGKLTLTAISLRQRDSQDPLGLTASALDIERKSADPAALAFNTRKSITHSHGGIVYEHRIGTNHFQTSAYAGDRKVTQFQAIPVSAQTGPASSGGVIAFDREFSGASVRWTSQQQLFAGILTTSIGVEYETMEDKRRGFENFIGTTLGVKGTLRRDELDTVSSRGAYLQTDFQGDFWGFHAGLRHSRVQFLVDDRFLSNGNDSGRSRYSQVSPAYGLTYRPSPEHTWYFSAGEGFETPTLNELFYSRAGAGFNFGLQPARGRHVEVGIKSRWNDLSKINISAFRIRTSDELVVDISRGGRTSYRNATSTQRSGIEMSAEHQMTPSTIARVALSSLDARFPSPDSPNAKVRIPGIPRWSAQADVEYRHSRSGTFAGLELVANGKAYVDDRNAEPAAPSYVAWNIRLGAEQKKGAWLLKQFIRLNNILDKEFVGSVIVNEGNRRYYEPAPGLNWLAGVSAQFTF